jgi:hypothetical protein
VSNCGQQKGGERSKASDEVPWRPKYLGFVDVRACFELLGTLLTGTMSFTFLIDAGSSSSSLESNWIPAKM